MNTVTVGKCEAARLLRVDVRTLNRAIELEQVPCLATAKRAWIPYAALGKQWDPDREPLPRPGILPLARAADRIGLDRRTMALLATDGQIPTISFGRRRVVPAGWVEDWIAGHPCRPAAYTRTYPDF